ncbi:hypothetical protein A5634_04085 [Mycobacterium asiaticum]|uniref:Lipoprotein LpqH n=1 Tax=Mycobacterium asiaticum TaxID=1790 RepID=A0A1A3NV07_MYCAS|nr:lipoprotein LpqH [Mycobacterium asiaticum]OBK24172.1 hypothetical protein A5634_04085 [Mycobacterium asiaticum]
MQNRLVAVAGIALVVAGAVSGCGDPQIMPRKAAHLTVGDQAVTAQPPVCSQIQSYRTVDIRDRDGHVQAVVLLSGDRIIPQFVKIRNINGFTGSYYEGGVGNARVVGDKHPKITGSASGINSSNPNKVMTTDFEISVEC